MHLREKNVRNDRFAFRRAASHAAVAAARPLNLQRPCTVLPCSRHEPNSETSEGPKHMSSNHTLLTIGAFVLLVTLLQNFYGMLGTTGGDITGAQDMILASTLATSYMETAQGLAFDEITDTTNLALASPSSLTPANQLGRDGTDEDSLQRFDDFDDFSGYTIEREANHSGRRYTSSFQVSYVDPASPNTVSTARTFVKRIDLKCWRSFPPPAGTALDTLRMSLVMGYFHFD